MARRQPAVLVVIASVVVGCGSPVVDPGVAETPRSSPLLAIGAEQAAPATLEELEGVPADSAMVLPVSDTGTEYHEAAAGESFDTIARSYGVTEEALRKTNGLAAGAVLQPGQLLRIPR